MIKDVFSSFSHTIGKILAYLLLAFLIFLLFGKVKAESLDASRYQVQSIRTNWGIGYNNYINNNTIAVDGNINTIPPTANSVMGWQWLPVNSSNAYLPLNNGEYSISITFELGFLTNNSFPYNPLYVQLSVGGNYVNASCDGQVSFERLETEIGGGSNYIAENKYEYLCSRLIVNQNFDRVRMRVYWNGMPNNISVIAFRPIEFTLNDLNNISNDTSVIINNDNINTQNIINNANQNSQSETNAINAINDSLMSNTPADTSILTNIQNMMPLNTPVTDIITLPIQILNKEINTLTNGTCQAWQVNFGTLFNNYVLTIPCINPGTYFNSSSFSWGGYGLWNLIDLIFAMYMAYNICMLVYGAYHSITNLDDTVPFLYRYYNPPTSGTQTWGR